MSRTRRLPRAARGARGVQAAQRELERMAHTTVELVVLRLRLRLGPVHIRGSLSTRRRWPPRPGPPPPRHTILGTR